MKIIQLRDESKTIIDLEVISMITLPHDFNENICIYSFNISIGFQGIKLSYPVPFLENYNIDHNIAPDVFRICIEDYHRIRDFLLDKRKNDFLERIEDLEEKVDHLLYILDKGEIRLTKNQKKNIAAGIEVLDEAIKEIKVKKGK